MISVYDPSKVKRTFLKTVNNKYIFSECRQIIKMARRGPPPDTSR